MLAQDTCSGCKIMDCKIESDVMDIIGFWFDFGVYCPICTSIFVPWDPLRYLIDVSLNEKISPLT